MKIIAPAFILLALLAACQPKPKPPVAGAALGMPVALKGAKESAAMEGVEGPGQ